MRTVHNSSRLLGVGVTWSGGVCFQVGMCLLRGVCSGGVPAPGGCLLPRGCLLPEGCLLRRGLLPGGACSGGVSPPGGGGIPVLRQTPLWTDRLEIVVLWSLVWVNLVVAFGFLPRNFGRWWSLRIIFLLANNCSLSGEDNHRPWGHSPPTGW